MRTPWLPRLRDSFSAVLALIALAGSLQATQPFQPVVGDPLVEPWRWRTYPELTGLNAQCMAEGEGGVLWFGTPEGLWSFDGIAWKFHRHSGSTILSMTAICPGRDGALYICSNRAIGRRSRTGEFSHLFPRTGSFASVHRMIAKRDGLVAAATSWGLLLERKHDWVLYTTPEIAATIRPNSNPGLVVRHLPASVREKHAQRRRSQPLHTLTDISEDPAGRLWVGSVDGEVLCFTPPADTAPADADISDDAWQLHHEADGMICGRTPSVLALEDGSILVVYSAGSKHANAYRDGRWHTTPLSAWGLPEDGGALLQTDDGVVWLSGRYALYARRDGTWRKYTRPEFPVPTARNMILQTSDGALWICGPGTEIQRIHYQTTRWLTLHDLAFQWEGPGGAEWFLHRTGRVVVHDRAGWTSFGPEDGLIDAPVVLLGTSQGEVWVAGSHEQTAATARFDGRTWTRHIHREFSWGIEPRGVIESSDGSLWFSATVDSAGRKEWRAGILQYREGKWLHHHQPGRAPTGQDDRDLSLLLPATQRPEPIGKFVVLGESRDGRIWAGRNILVYREKERWHIFDPAVEFRRNLAKPARTERDIRLGNIETMFTSREGDLWIGTRQFGALRYDGRSWYMFLGADDLPANSVRSMAQAEDGSLWAATDRDISRFDGDTWTSDLLPAALNIPLDGGGLEAARGGRLWINRVSPVWNRRAWGNSAPQDLATCEFWTVCRGTVTTPPETTLKAASNRVPPPGNLSVFWDAQVRWAGVNHPRVQFSHRLDDESWSPFTSERGHSFFTLSPGRHRLEVRARDIDFNIDPTPATLDFVVLPPVWRQAWFVTLMALVAGLLLLLVLGVILERGRLRRTNRTLAAEIKQRERIEDDLRKLNRDLDQRVKSRTAQLELANRELESFAYSVSHDLRAPLRRIDGFSQAVLQDCADRLDEESRTNLNIVRSGAQHMGRLIDDLLRLSSVARSSMRVSNVDLSRLARDIVAELVAREPQRTVAVSIAPNLTATGDARFLAVALENLLANAWKFTSRRSDAHIEFAAATQNGERVYFVRDNGAGFDMTQESRLFQPFRRLHTEEEFPGTGIGLATVKRIIQRHGGRIWAEGKPGEGATFHFTLPDQSADERTEESY